VAENLVRPAFDLVVLLVISNVVRNAVILLFDLRRADRVIEHAPTLLVRHGRILRQNPRRERRGPRDLRAALRRHGVVSVRDIRYAFLEEDGHVSGIAGRPRGE
jgi:uncharacterized membrane protein YcaP (DUF421 family)